MVLVQGVCVFGCFAMIVVVSIIAIFGGVMRTKRDVMRSIESGTYIDAGIAKKEELYDAILEDLLILGEEMNKKDEEKKRDIYFKAIFLLEEMSVHCPKSAAYLKYALDQLWN